MYSAQRHVQGEIEEMLVEMQARLDEDRTLARKIAQMVSGNGPHDPMTGSKLIRLRPRKAA